MWGALPAGRAPRAHFSGIGGTGMVGVARLAVEAGWDVRGSDNPLYPPSSTMVEALGVPVFTSYAATNLDWQPDVVVVGNALSRGNAELEAVLDRGLPYVSFPEWLRFAVLQSRRPIVVSGTHGKTTTTAITAFLLEQCGLRPGWLIGGQPLDFAHPSALGAPGGPFAIEGDEYDTAFYDKRAKFFHYLPRTLIVTSLEFDHADIYSDVEEIERAFRILLREVPRSGHVLLCADQPRALALRTHVYSNVHSYGFDASADWRVEALAATPAGETFRIHRHGAVWGEFSTKLFGRHNLQNSAAALIAAAIEGAPPDALARALAKFRGIKRRMEIFLEARGLVFVDDFAHHPTAIRETIAAAKSRWPGQNITVVFEPRSNTTATNRMQKELGEAFDGATEVWIGPIYRAEKYAEALRLDRDRLVADISRRGPRANYADDIEAIVSHLRGHAQSGDIVLVLSNGAFGGIYDLIRSKFGQYGYA
jgi:UDP-N-acetylmuramate: L-alanyl-gamma-D-glutamyl-meso-diaminopimelate ligase